MNKQNNLIAAQIAILSLINNEEVSENIKKELEKENSRLASENFKLICENFRNPEIFIKTA